MAAQTFRPVVDYSLRPAKAVVRRLVVEVVSRLNPITPVNRLRYIGMGSTYFRDFHLMHRRLRIDDMVSIEAKTQAQKRIEFNCPLSCINLIMKSTSDALPELGLGESPDLIWLDYESRADAGVLSDVEHVVLNCAPSSILIVSVKADTACDDTEIEEWLADVGVDLEQSSLPRSRSAIATESYAILRGHVDDAIRKRSAGSLDHERIEFHQLLHVVYADTMQMLTIGGILVRNDARENLQRCSLEGLEFLRHEDEPFKVKIPRLTRSEVHYVLKHFPEGGARAREAAKEIGIPPSEIASFESLYRYAPLFVEVDDW